jgi:hypothetical protein
VREWDDTDGDALADAVVSVPVVFKTDLNEISDKSLELSVLTSYCL